MTPDEYKEACHATGRNSTELAEILGISRATFFRRFHPGAPITGEMILAIGAVPVKKKSERNKRPQ